MEKLIPYFVFMCFSATASFAASAVLAGTGSVSVRKTKGANDKYLAALPFLFAIQQGIEGLLWLTPKPSLLAQVLAYKFLFFAFLLWPTYIPFAVWKHERNPRRQHVLKIVLIFGFLGTLYLLLGLLTQPLFINVTDHHLNYLFDVPLELIGVILYVAVVVGSFLLSTKIFLKIFGMLVLCSVYVAWQVYEQTFTSVWCFFTALLSILIAGYFIYDSRPAKI